MSKKMRGEAKRKLPYPHKEEAEFGKGKKGVFSCKRCRAYYYKKSWHHELSIPRVNKRKEFTIGYTWCPACAMMANNEYEGKVIIKNAPPRLIPEIKNLIESYSKRAYQKDTQHRLIEIKRENDDLVATTTENQLAAKLGRKIKETFKKADLEVTHATEPSDVTLARVVFRND